MELSTSTSYCTRWRAWAIALLLATVTLVTFWPVTGNDFVNYDDSEYVYNNAHVRQGLSWSNIGWAFSTGHAGNYHPMTWLSLMADSSLWGTSPRGFHATNLVLHAMNCGLLLLVLRAASGSTWRSAMAASIFALHPLRVESVAWATERKDVLSMFFALLTIGAYVRYAAKPGALRYIVVAMLLELALLSKSTIVTLPAILLLLDFWPLRRVALESSDTNPLRRPIGRLVVEKIPLLGLSIIACVATLFAQSAGNAIGSAEKYPLLARLGNALVSYVTYIRKMVVPTDLAVFYPHQTSSAWMVLVALIALVAITALALQRRISSPWLTVGWLWFLGALVPMIGLVQSGAQSMADRFTYLPMIGLVIAAAWAIPQALFDTPRGRWKLATVATMVLLALAVLSREQISHWRDSESLFTHALMVTSDNHVAHNNLAFEFSLQGRLRDAKSHYQAALLIKPSFSIAHNGLGSVLARRGDVRGAMREYGLAIQHNANYALAHRNLAGQFAAAGMTDLAIEHYSRSVQLRQDDAAARSLLGMNLAKAGRVGDAIVHFQAAADADPSDAQARVNLGRALVEMKRPDEALIALRRAVQLDPKSADAHYHAGAALAQFGDLPAAADAFRAALDLQPDDRDARAALDEVTARQKQPSASVAE